MKNETITERDDLLIRRMVLEPGEATAWHLDACHRFTVVIRGTKLAIEFRDSGDVSAADVPDGAAGWDAPEPRVHRAVNQGSTAYEEVVTFYRSSAAIEPQPGAGEIS